MKVEMARPEFLAAIRSDRDFVRQQPILVVEDFQRARVFRFRRGAFIAACHEDRELVVGGCAHLVSINPGLDRARLLHFLAERGVFVDAVDPHGAWVGLLAYSSNRKVPGNPRCRWTSSACRSRRLILGPSSENFYQRPLAPAFSVVSAFLFHRPPA